MRWFILILILVIIVSIFLCIKIFKRQRLGGNDTVTVKFTEEETHNNTVVGTMLWSDIPINDDYIKLLLTCEYSSVHDFIYSLMNKNIKITLTSDYTEFTEHVNTRVGEIKTYVQNADSTSLIKQQLSILLHTDIKELIVSNFRYFKKLDVEYLPSLNEIYLIFASNYSALDPIILQYFCYKYPSSLGRYIYSLDNNYDYGYYSSQESYKILSSTSEIWYYSVKDREEPIVNDLCKFITLYNNGDDVYGLFNNCFSLDYLYDDANASLIRENPIHCYQYSIMKKIYEANSKLTRSNCCIKFMEIMSGVSIENCEQSSLNFNVQDGFMYMLMIRTDYSSVISQIVELPDYWLWCDFNIDQHHMCLRILINTIILNDTKNNDEYMEILQKYICPGMNRLIRWSIDNDIICIPHIWAKFGHSSITYYMEEGSNELGVSETDIPNEYLEIAAIRESENAEHDRDLIINTAIQLFVEHFLGNEICNEDMVEKDIMFRYNNNLTTRFDVSKFDNYLGILCLDLDFNLKSLYNNRHPHAFVDYCYVYNENYIICDKIQAINEYIETNSNRINFNDWFSYSYYHNKKTYIENIIMSCGTRDVVINVVIDNKMLLLYDSNDFKILLHNMERFNAVECFNDVIAHMRFIHSNIGIDQDIEDCKTINELSYKVFVIFRRVLYRITDNIPCKVFVMNILLDAFYEYTPAFNQDLIMDENLIAERGWGDDDLYNYFKTEAETTNADDYKYTKLPRRVYVISPDGNQIMYKNLWCNRSS